MLALVLVISGVVMYIFSFIYFITTFNISKFAFMITFATILFMPGREMKKYNLNSLNELKKLHKNMNQEEKNENLNDYYSSRTIWLGVSMKTTEQTSSKTQEQRKKQGQAMS